MLRTAITGGIACGKSLVGSFLAASGVPVCEADELAHELMMPGTAVFDEVREEFGPGILNSDGGIDRVLLGDLVFSDPARLARLNAITHPPIEKAWDAWLAASEVAGAPAAAVVVPLLYEIGRGTGWDAVICVAACESLRLVRLRGRGLSCDAARRRMEAQCPIIGKMAMADYVVVNDSTRAVVGEQTRRILGNILKR